MAAVKLFICEACGYTFSDTAWCCPACCSNHVVEAAKCPECGDIVAEDSLCLLDDGVTWVCQDCADDHASKDFEAKMSTVEDSFESDNNEEDLQ